MEHFSLPSIHFIYRLLSHCCATRIGNRKNVFIRKADTQHDLKRTVAKCRTGNNWYSMALWSFNARNGCNIWTRYTEWAAWLGTRAISWRRTGSLWTLVKNFQEWILLSHVNKWSCESYKFWSSEVTHLPSDSHLSDTVLAVCCSVAAVQLHSHRITVSGYVQHY